MERLKNKVAIITGAALGIGKATALMFAKEGAKVAVTDILEDEGRALVQEIQANGGDAMFSYLNVSSEFAVQDVLEEVFNKWGRLDILVNNAGIAGVNSPTDQVTEKEWDKVMGINVKGVFFCTKYAIGHMQQSGGGSIINISSIYGIISAPDLPPYHASKGAVRSMSKTDALLYAKDNIRVNSVHPGFIWTPLVENHLKNSGSTLEVGRKNLDALHPLGRVGKPDEIAYGILFLASDESSFVTGAELVIDGGYTAQ
ncbi:SDR family NAD(P)-dependent oxidoreductase [Roseivirga echinicomitans]|uniref:Short-chain dehydrogenase n=1 Tax=Roseivirga echinicomitans TaxID=296218 RepID=A0A150XV43_9BACT|nr:glucose 1-dehydrogenase [Roseivirga echinicomitans]KYG82621.1 short-chain dehydrogenase [Roseivirga echinicomitans]